MGIINQKEYKKILNATIVPSRLSEKEQNNKYDTLNDFVNKYFPASLYRYRKCTELQIEAFYNDKIYCSSGVEVNDNFDALIYYDKCRVDDWIKSFKANDTPLQILKSLKSSSNIPAELYEYIPCVEDFVRAIQSVPDDQLEIAADEFKAYLSCNIEVAIDSIIAQTQNILKFACFSEDIKSAAMWGYYADSGKGFALGYDFRNGHLTECISCSKLYKECRYPKLCHLYPIVYDNDRLDATDFVIYLFQIMKLKEQAFRKNAILPNEWLNQIVPCPDLFMSSKIALNKSYEWKAEREWRLFCTSNQPEFGLEKYPYIMKKPKALYLGKNISAIHQKVLIDIAKEKKIKVYKMSIDNSSNKYKFRAEEIKY